LIVCLSIWRFLRGDAGARAGPGDESIAAQEASAPLSASHPTAG